jgi:hypothetical protein
MADINPETLANAADLSPSNGDGDGWTTVRHNAAAAAIKRAAMNHTETGRPCTDENVRDLQTKLVAAETELAARSAEHSPTFAQATSVPLELQNKLAVSEAAHAAVAAELHTLRSAQAAALETEIAARHLAEQQALETKRLFSEGKAQRSKFTNFLKSIYLFIFSSGGIVFGSVVRNGIEGYLPGEDLTIPPPQDCPLDKKLTDIDIFVPQSDWIKFVRDLRIFLESHGGTLTGTTSKSSSVINRDDGELCACDSFNIKVPGMPIIPIDIVHAGSSNHLLHAQDVSVINMAYLDGVGLHIREPRDRNGRSVIGPADGLHCMYKDDFENRRAMLVLPDKHSSINTREYGSPIWRFKAGPFAKRLIRLESLVNTGFTSYVSDLFVFDSTIVAEYSQLNKCLTAEQMDHITAPDASNPEAKPSCPICKVEFDDMSEDGEKVIAVYPRCNPEGHGHIHCMTCTQRLVQNVIRHNGPSAAVKCSVCRADFC